MPLNILFAFVSGYLSSEKPFMVQQYNLLAIIAVSLYTINVLLQYFPDENNITQVTVIHVSITIFVLELIQSFEFVTAFAILMKYTDKRISGIHVTVLAAVYNLCEFLHKFYIFKLVDMFGLFTPQLVLSGIGLAVWIIYRKRFLELQHKPVSSWHVKDSTLRRSKSVEDEL